MRIGIIGSGRIGGAIARQLARAGHELVLSSRRPETLEGLARELGPPARTGTVRDAAAFGEVVALAIPYGAVGDTGAVIAPAVAGKIVVDVTNYYAERDGDALDPGEQSTSAIVARAFPDARVVKAFNTIYFRRLEGESRPPGDDQLAILLAGDDAEAKATVAGLVREIGFAPVDTGSLADSRRQEPGSPVNNEPLTAAQAEEALA